MPSGAACDLSDLELVGIVNLAWTARPKILPEMINTQPRKHNRFALVEARHHFCSMLAQGAWHQGASSLRGCRE